MMGASKKSPAERQAAYRARKKAAAGPIHVSTQHTGEPELLKSIIEQIEPLTDDEILIEEQALSLIEREAKEMPGQTHTRNSKTPINHGTITGYFNRKCRCDLCRIAATTYSRNKRQENLEKLDYSTIVHGTKHSYAQLGCRCQDCLKAMRDYQKQYEMSPEARERARLRKKQWFANRTQEQRDIDAQRRRNRTLRDKAKRAELQQHETTI